MGFRFKRVEFTGGSGLWGSSSTARSRAEITLKSIALAIISPQTGWGFDRERLPSDSSGIIEVPYIDSGGETMPGTFLVNSVSGDKLFIAYIASRCDHGIDLPASQLAPWGDVASPS